MKNLEESINTDLKDYFLEQLDVMGSDYPVTFTEEYLNGITGSGYGIPGIQFRHVDETGDI